MLSEQTIAHCGKGSATVQITQKFLLASGIAFEFLSKYAWQVTYISTA